MATTTTKKSALPCGSGQESVALAAAPSSSDNSCTSEEEESDVYERGNWGSQVDFMLSCVGYAVGLGNLWRFPYLCMRNGGGAFLIPYFTFLFLCGIPLFFMELSLGQFSSRSPVSIWEISPLFKGLGYGMVIVSGVVCIYYNVILAWALYYMGMSFTTGALPWATCGNAWNTPACVSRASDAATVGRNLSALWNGTTNVTMASVHTSTAAYQTSMWALANASSNATLNATLKSKTPADEFWHNNVLEYSEGIERLGYVRWQLLLCLLAAWLLVFLCLCKGVKSSGKVVYVTATMPYLMLLVMLVRGLTLDGAVEGIKYYLTPDFNRLLEFRVWGEACAQIFYSLGPAYGGLITMSSYNKFHNNCYRDAIIIPCINCGTSFFAGFVVFSIIGFLAHTTKLDVKDVIVSGPGLAFVVYPEVLSMLPFAPFWSAVFFMMLVIIGLDTQFGMFETMTSCFIDEFPTLLKTKKTQFVAVMCVSFFLLGIPMITQGGIYIFQIMDWYSCTFSLITIAMLECLVVSWIYGASNLYDDIALMIGYKPNIWWRICWMIVTPGILLIVLTFFMATFTDVTYGDYVYPKWATLMGWTMALCSLVPIPVLMVWSLTQARGSFLERLRSLLRPSQTWGPALAEHRKGTQYAIVAAHDELENVKMPQKLHIV